MNKLFSLHYIHIIDVHLLLWGDDTLTYLQNTEIFKIVHVFLYECGRFRTNVNLQ